VAALSEFSPAVFPTELLSLAPSRGLQRAAAAGRSEGCELILESS
jgi:hypothetical protein